MALSLSGQRVTINRPLSPIIEEWRTVVQDYHKALPGDAIYFYTEQALVSSLIGATWRLKGCVAIMEWQTKRGRKVSEQRRGRADLYVKVSDGANLGGYIIEAKMLVQDIGPRSSSLSKLSKKVDKILDEEKGRAEGIQEYGEKLGMLFVVPVFLAKYEHQEHDPIQRFLLNLKQVDVDIGWNLTFTDYRKEENVWPGVAVLFK